MSMITPERLEELRRAADAECETNARAYAENRPGPGITATIAYQKAVTDMYESISGRMGQPVVAHRFITAEDLVRCIQIVMEHMDESGPVDVGKVMYGVRTTLNLR